MIKNRKVGHIGFGVNDIETTAKWYVDVLGFKVIGEFICDKITPFDVPYPAFQQMLDKSIMEQSCLTYYQLHRYAYHDCLFGWRISELKIYRTPKELSEFGLTRPPQSWCYVKGE